MTPKTKTNIPKYTEHTYDRPPSPIKKKRKKTQPLFRQVRLEIIENHCSSMIYKQHSNRVILQWLRSKLRKLRTFGK